MNLHRVSALLFAALVAGCGNDVYQSAARAEAQAVTLLITDYINPITKDAGYLVEQVSAARVAGQPRGQLRALVEPVLLADARYFGVALAFEPDAYDGEDAEHRFEKPESDEAGRFAPYFYKADGEVLVEPLSMNPDAGIDAWYSQIVEASAPGLLDPHVYPVAGRDRILASICMPILEGADAIGVVTIDAEMDALVTAIEKRDAAWPGIIWVIGNEGNWVAHPNVARIGHSIDATGDHAAVASDELAAIEAYRALDQSGGAQSIPDGLPFATRTTFSNLPQHWTVIVSQPQ